MGFIIIIIIIVLLLFGQYWINPLLTLGIHIHPF